MIAPLLKPVSPVLFHRPLVSLWIALSLIGGKNPGEIISLIEEGKLRWAFDIRKKWGKRREIRILAQSINEYLTGSAAPNISEQQDFCQAMHSIFPMPKLSITACDIACAWNASPEHILNLCRSRQLGLAKGACNRRGRGGSPQVTMESAVEFLRKRRFL